MFRLLGFEVRIQPGFVMFMLLIIVIYGDEFGIWLAASIAIFTLIHELGHAVAARQAGAHAEISLGFLAGYAAYSPTRPISRARHAWISFAGPGVHIATSVAVLVAMGANPIDRNTFDGSATFAIWWAGPAIGALNLIPILPLDGGNIVLQGLDRILPGRAHRIMLYASLVITGTATVLMFTNERLRGFAIFIGFLMITQLQMLNAGKPAPSPWADANAALVAGKPGKARRVLTAALSHQRDQQPQPFSIPPENLGALIDLLPEPLPHGDPTNEYLLANVLISIGRYEAAAHYAAASFGRTPNTLSASAVARASGALGDQSTAISWLEAAANAGTSPVGLASVIDGSPELVELRGHPDVVSIRHRIAG